MGMNMGKDTDIDMKWVWRQTWTKYSIDKAENGN
jgi:hypothetical protein